MTLTARQIEELVERCRAAGLIPLYAEQAKEREHDHAGKFAHMDKPAGRARAKAAEAVNVSPRTVANAVAVTWKAKQERAKAETSKARSEAKRGNQYAANNRPSREGALNRDRSEAKRSRETATRLATEAGVSRATMERAMELERKHPEAAAAVARGEVEGHKALAEVKRAVRVERLIEVPA